MSQPTKISQDPRFQLARSLLSSEDADGKSGPEAAIEIFATLLEECRKSFGETSLDAAICQYEYGNALFRAFLRTTPLEDSNLSDDKKPAAMEPKAEEAAGGKRRPHSIDDEETMHGSPSGMKRIKLEYVKSDKESSVENGGAGELLIDDSEVLEEEDDVDLALEMMETSFAIFESRVSNEENNLGESNKRKISEEQKQWASGQLPRILIGIADAYSFRGKYGNAVDAYCRALPYREKAWEEMKKSQSEEDLLTVDHLKCQRHLVEAYALIAETLLNCPDGEDVICYYDANERDEDNDDQKLAVTKSSHASIEEDIPSSVLVKAEERVNFARSHYEMARVGLEEIGEWEIMMQGVRYLFELLYLLAIFSFFSHLRDPVWTVYRMGKMAAAGKELGNEKEDICYLVTMLVGLASGLSEAENK